jgi:hypothetical protein
MCWELHTKSNKLKSRAWKLKVKAAVHIHNNLSSVLVTGVCEWLEEILWKRLCSWLTEEFCFVFFECVAGQGLGKLYNEVRSCHYEDVQVMWSMLQQSHHPLGSPKRRRITRSFQWWTGRKPPGIQLLVSSCDDVGGGKGLGSYNTVRSCH